MNTFIHKTEQRLRVRSDFIRNNPQQIQQDIEKLQQMEAIEAVKHKVYAGSVAIRFDHQKISCEALLEMLSGYGWTKVDQKQFFIENAAVKGTKSVAKGLVALAFIRLVVPSVTRLIV
ncbi:HMA2 domain-containing protein [Vibrio quintilis]|uniref:HMA domain-containing protein n=1 Tax=Vibrio quintilis TaxID=1117707 RepID=A0A1M7YR86_9VIBR|nr:hypothetical protein [Vibrio quintilis]SHO55095.1 hypothetical protein VQ7734_00814 [Vibrio quintilis]